jgi:hypothetical protein
VNLNLESSRRVGRNAACHYITSMPVRPSLVSRLSGNESPEVESACWPTLATRLSVEFSASTSAVATSSPESGVLPGSPAEPREP